MFKDDTEAFTPFFDETVGYHGKRQHLDIDTNFKACVFPADNIEPISDLDTASEVMAMSISIKEEDWTFDKVKPQIGDAITLEDGTKLNVAKVMLQHGIYNFEARG